MPRLTNNALRTKNLDALLKDMGILENTVVNCKDELVILKPATPPQAEQLARDIQNLLITETTKPEIKRVTLSELLSAEIDAAICNDVQMAEKNKRSLQALLPILDLDFELDAEQEFLDIKLPATAYIPLFNSLTYQHIKLQGETLKFNLKAFLNDHRDELTLIDGKSPLLVCDTAQFESKRVFYSQKQVSDNEVEVTPHLFIPCAIKPPHYTFVLDTSGSMNEPYKLTEGTTTRLQLLQKSVIKFAEALYEFHPDATINISQFNNTMSKVGSYQKRDLERLRSNVNRLASSGGTNLFATTAEQLSSISELTGYNNVLLFTDGENQDQSEPALIRTIESLESGSPLVLARNKFFIVSYGASQPAILFRVAKAFDSPVIETDSPDFVSALSKTNEMQRWAAARDLFTCRFEVAASNSDSMRQEIYVHKYDLSGQFVALDPMRCKVDEIIHLTVTDANSQILLDDTKPAVKKPGVEMFEGLEVFEELVVQEQEEAVEPVEEQPLLPSIGTLLARFGAFVWGGSANNSINPTPPTDGETMDKHLLP